MPISTITVTLLTAKVLHRLEARKSAVVVAVKEVIDE